MLDSTTIRHRRSDLALSTLLHFSGYHRCYAGAAAPCGVPNLSGADCFWIASLQCLASAASLLSRPIPPPSRARTHAHTHRDMGSNAGQEVYHDHHHIDEREVAERPILCAGQRHLGPRVALPALAQLALEQAGEEEGEEEEEEEGRREGEGGGGTGTAVVDSNDPSVGAESATATQLLRAVHRLYQAQDRVVAEGGHQVSAAVEHSD
eukprot:COSAG01_NODE_17852_length_1119_cov_1.723529_1_plen_208_part_00